MPPASAPPPAQTRARSPGCSRASGRPPAGSAFAGRPSGRRIDSAAVAPANRPRFGVAAAAEPHRCPRPPRPRCWRHGATAAAAPRRTARRTAREQTRWTAAAPALEPSSRQQPSGLRSQCAANPRCPLPVGRMVSMLSRAFQASDLGCDLSHRGPDSAAIRWAPAPPGHPCLCCCCRF